MPSVVSAPTTPLCLSSCIRFDSVKKRDPNNTYQIQVIKTTPPVICQDPRKP
ncbi:hypothetical protein BOTBODRAFT_181670 [Botryobasidium botryosum FD-172 SS1]|uniref:Uncharacterized protein n=1 Tax=Botryobasidium botryosum (strain FD-172 SS1) TaxID=930990 RepID=A0A067M467_BOTB1|nr:hypothetical protein BOTBODRAFT_181670 [Botryobasidium botryosum FD-172 SS1]